MDNDTKIFSLIIVCVAATVCSVVWATSLYYTSTTKAAMNAGYVQASLPGCTGAYWVKAEQAPEIGGDGTAVGE